MRTLPLLLVAIAAAALTRPALSQEAQKPEKNAPAYLQTGAQRKLDFVYKQVLGRELCLDLYYPPGDRDAPCPLVIYTHGGGWAAGSRHGVSKRLFEPLFSRLIEKGFCVATVDYRLWNKGRKTSMRDCVIDCKDAARRLAQQGRSLGVDPQRFFVMGDSAGGQIAQMLTLTSPEVLPGDPELADVSYRVVAGVSWYGPCDFENQDLFNHDDRPDFKDRFGARILRPDSDPGEKTSLYREMSPINYLTKDSPPLLMVQGDQDTTIPVKHALAMQQRAEALGAPVEVVIVKNAGHNWRRVGADIDPPFEAIVDRSARFIEDHR
ncbi:Carboxylesterase NlhH [Pirellulimonas nuda]|uniref:Carboxylesterase NlhH n=1 Tax=Pirellulimonas nuda TaxID=2528009 RepID=A0A518DH12_9BACT|nr:alpha/beta hydrolase [Pirellulimonas nuda]QDU90763.1 Carboxylesterase NlhH [Pirellulimonas nuda]